MDQEDLERVGRRYGCGHQVRRRSPNFPLLVEIPNQRTPAVSAQAITTRHYLALHSLEREEIGRTAMDIAQDQHFLLVLSALAGSRGSMSRCGRHVADVYLRFSSVIRRLRTGEYNVTLGRRPVSKIPCFLCVQELTQRTDKNRKPYFICDPCGVQIFIRGRQGIKNLSQLIATLKERDFPFREHAHTLYEIQAVLTEIRAA